jgi:hypothetical protein
LASPWSPDQIAGLGLQGVRTVWILDADAGGRARRDTLVEADVPRERVLLLTDGSDLEVEDLVVTDTYVAAVREYVKDTGASEIFAAADLLSAPCRRHEAVEAWCDARQLRKPSKIAIANKIIGLAGESPLLDPKHGDGLRNLHERVVSLFS